MGPMKIIDGDGHIIEDGQAISKFLPSPYREKAGFNGGSRIFPALDHLHGGQGLSENPPGAFTSVDANHWIAFADDIGIETAVLYPTQGLACGNMNSPDWAIAVTRAYNDYLYETFLSKTPRLKGMGLIPMQDPEAAVEELRHVVKDLGMCGAMLPSTGLGIPIGAKQYWPIYREAERLGCCLAVHGGAHGGLGLDQLTPHPGVHSLGHPFGIMVCFASIVFNGIFDKFPNLRIAFLEGGVAWFLMCLERYNRSYETHIPFDPSGNLLRLEANEPVSDYIIRHVKAGRIFVSCEGDEPALAFATRAAGSEPFMFSSDFPHEVNNEYCKAEIQKLVENEEMSEATKAGILYENALRFYKLQPLAS